MNTFDITIFHLINQWAGHTPLLDKTMSFIAQYALELYAILFVLDWFTLPRADANHRHTLVIMGFAGILALGLNVIIAQLWYRPRPFVTLPQGTFTNLVQHPADASFPSDHVSGSFGFAAAAWGKANNWVSRSFTILAVLVAVARIYIGVHWPTDVIAGAVVGMLSAKILWSINSILKPLTNLGLRTFHFGKWGGGTEIGNNNSK